MHKNKLKMMFDVKCKSVSVMLMDDCTKLWIVTH